MKIKILCLALCFYLSNCVYAYKVGVPSFDPPYTFSGNSGFVIDFSTVLCKKLKVNCIFVPMKYSELFFALDDGTIDWAMGGFFIKPSNHYIYSLPFLMGRSRLLTLKTSNINKVADLQGKNIGIIQLNPEGTVYEDFLNKNFFAQFKITIYDSTPDLINALKDGSISAAFMHFSSAQYWELNSDGLFVAIGPVYEVGEGIAVISHRKNSKLIQLINTQIPQMETDDTYLNLYKTYFNQCK